MVDLFPVHLELKFLARRPLSSRYDRPRMQHFLSSLVVLVVSLLKIMVVLLTIVMSLLVVTTTSLPAAVLIRIQMSGN